MQESPEAKKDVVLRFNREVIEKGNMDALAELVAPDFVNHTAPPGTPGSREGLGIFLTQVLRPAFPDLRMEIHDQIVEGDRVVTRKTMHATHTGAFRDLPATGRPVQMRIIDIVTVRNGKYVEHWGSSDMHGLLVQIGG
ncbi:MAG TPA: ester cyclase [Candidatus Kapabacteria bacterium]|nr:ester cyclase [Candidatus Kapabacteria bacterium]